MTIDVRSVVVPDFLYGTAWKEEATAACVTRALAAGFRGLDTANQRKHYHEAGVGDALRAALASGQVRRDPDRGVGVQAVQRRRQQGAAVAATGVDPARHQLGRLGAPAHEQAVALLVQGARSRRPTGPR